MFWACSDTHEEGSTQEVEEASIELPEVEAVQHPELYVLIQEKDSLLFQVGFNQIDTAMVASLIAEDFEFFHDEHGLMNTKQDFLNSIQGIKELPFKTWRVLVDGTVEVYPMYRDNKQELYGILQNGVHEFFQQYEGEEAQQTSTAQFSHLWILENNEWKLKRVFSYDHQNSK